jgi:hypothetical protein
MEGGNDAQKRGLEVFMGAARKIVAALLPAKANWRRSGCNVDADAFYRGGYVDFDRSGCVAHPNRMPFQSRADAAVGDWAEMGCRESETPSRNTLPGNFFEIFVYARPIFLEK